MEKNFEEALSGKKIAPLTLDQKWHQLFQAVKPSRQLKSLEKQLDALIKRQGKLVTESKDIKKLKNKLMKEIMQRMESLEGGSPDAACEKKLDENRRLINECNEKLDAYQDELLDLPERIDRVNHALMIETMELCYCELKENADKIEQFDEWLTAVRIELKKQLLRKQDREVRNQMIYHYLHGIFGPDVVDLFDIRFDFDYKKKDQPDGEDAGGQEKTNS